MKVELLVSDWCPSCPQAEKVWRRVTLEREFEFAVVDMAQPEGRALAQRLRIKTIPATVIDGELKGVGAPSFDEARAWVAAAPEKAKRATAYHAGISMSADNRWFVLAAMGYLMLAGLSLPLNGALLLDGPARPALLHVYTLGFLAFLIYGLSAHMLPRFTGNPIRQGAWPWLQMALAHAGVWSYVLGYFMESKALAVGGGSAAWLALLLYTLRVLPVLWPRRSAEKIIAPR